jgi:hypothetical protein
MRSLAICNPEQLVSGDPIRENVAYFEEKRHECRVVVRKREGKITLRT